MEAIIRLMAPALDTLLFVGDRVARVSARRDEITPPVRRGTLGAAQGTPTGGPPA